MIPIEQNELEVVYIIQSRVSENDSWENNYAKLHTNLDDAKKDFHSRKQDYTHYEYRLAICVIEKKYIPFQWDTKE
jgi:hypothetical protein